jgi:hypothetical protein
MSGCASAFGRKRPIGLVGEINSSAGDEHGNSPPKVTVGEMLLECVEDEEADGALRLGVAPVECDRWYDVSCKLVLHHKVADLGTVAMGQDDLDALGHEIGDPLHGELNGRGLGGRGGAAVRTGHRIATERDQDPHGADSRCDRPNGVWAETAQPVALVWHGLPRQTWRTRLRPCCLPRPGRQLRQRLADRVVKQPRQFLAGQGRRWSGMDQRPEPSRS